MRKSIAVLSLVAAFALVAQPSPEVQLDAGLTAFRAQDYVAAERELAAAALALESQLAPGSGGPYERALVYLALVQARLGRDDDARATIERLLAAEKVDPVYNTLRLGDDGDEFETLVARLTPDAALTSTALPAVKPAPPPVRSIVVPAATAANLSHYSALRQADALAEQGQTISAQRIWESLSSAGDAPRDVLIEAAVGLYRVGAWRSALPAFERLGTLGRGEEDLRYYHAVVLYEAGHVDEARRELACALPYIQVTDDVQRYVLKINAGA